MIEVDVRSIALFFFFALLDGEKAVEATSQAIQNCKEQQKKNPELKPSVALVSATHSIWKKNKGQFTRGQHNYTADTDWLFPKDLDLGPWKEFQKSTPEDEFLALIWSQILKLPDEDISVGLAISVGTLRYRVGKALKKLGSLTQPVFVRGPANLGVVRK